MIEAYPLQWPIGYKRIAVKQHAAFQTTFASARDNTIRELKMLGAKDIIISTNIPLKRDNTPYAVEYGKWKNITDDTGIAVYFTLNNEQKVICCDAYLCFDDNMQAIRKSIEALRGLDRWKCSDMINQAFTGFKALPEQTGGAAWWDVLQCKQDASDEVIKAQYRRLAMDYHPDKNNGDNSKFIILQNAYQQALNK